MAMPKGSFVQRVGLWETVNSQLLATLKVGLRAPAAKYPGRGPRPHHVARYAAMSSGDACQATCLRPGAQRAGNPGRAATWGFRKLRADDSAHGRSGHVPAALARLARAALRSTESQHLARRAPQAAIKTKEGPDALTSRFDALDARAKGRVSKVRPRASAVGMEVQDFHWVLRPRPVAAPQLVVRTLLSRYMPDSATPVHDKVLVEAIMYWMRPDEEDLVTVPALIEAIYRAEAAVRELARGRRSAQWRTFWQWRSGVLPRCAGCGGEAAARRTPGAQGAEAQQLRGAARQGRHYGYRGYCCDEVHEAGAARRWSFNWRAARVC